MESSVSALSSGRRGRWSTWLQGGSHGASVHTAPWWQVMCLTGVDYFSTLGYQPGIAFLAAGFLSPIATAILVVVTLCCALPVYRRVAGLSPHGQGSISILEERLPRWRGKAAVLVLLGFAATDFVITMTLSAADATAHILENPFVPGWLDHPVGVTLVLLAALGGVFLRGFKEAIWLAVTIVVAYLALNVVIVAHGLWHIATHPDTLTYWRDGMFRQQPHVLMMLAAALLLFPRLALGLSGFETGVAVMPLVRGDGETDAARLQSRIARTRTLLLTAAVIMSVLLIASSLVTTMLIPPDAFEKGGEANGRALAYIAHRDFGDLFGTLYDISTISILWFAGASAMAGLLNLIPRYLPRYGMAPEWARASRPVVLLITLVGFAVTWIFSADVDAQGGAYATGVLVLMTSAAIAAAISIARGRPLFVAIALVFVYTTVANVYERPEGIQIAAWFIAGIVAASLTSRVRRSTELRAHGVEYDNFAEVIVGGMNGRAVRIIANRPDTGMPSEYATKLREATNAHHLPAEEEVLFLEIQPGDASAFSDVLRVSGRQAGQFRVLSVTSPAIPNAIAAILLSLRDRTGAVPHAYFGWTEGNPIAYLLKFLAFGEGDTAPVTREVLRQAEPDPARRPRIHVG